MPPATHAEFLPVHEVAGALAKDRVVKLLRVGQAGDRFTALTAKRLCEVRRATWEEIHLEHGRFRGPIR